MPRGVYDRNKVKKVRKTKIRSTPQLLNHYLRLVQEVRIVRALLVKRLGLD
jgi:hypothetical protein